MELLVCVCLVARERLAAALALESVGVETKQIGCRVNKPAGRRTSPRLGCGFIKIFGR